MERLGLSEPLDGSACATRPPPVAPGTLCGGAARGACAACAGDGGLWCSALSLSGLFSPGACCSLPARSSLWPL
ncbi:hypothetical protein [Sorangium cellulosum]|uniref:Uncharacterized protein n=1 Tax=Sorangium cellulosum So0157-2 TaxID=1254432 RepID=S4XSJ2_SORCE|nr:hypothetical protein [Sorangium cellulosum]AGP36157.1 hypothetical protein SCE1572_17650 [Sorangium cellulosum So0157-2]